MNGTPLPKCYQDHEPPAGYYDSIDPDNPITPSFEYCVRDVSDYISQKGMDPYDLSWDELQMFRIKNLEK